MYLLDTNVVSELRKSRADPSVLRWFRESAEQPMYLSVLTLGEIRRGIALLEARDRLQATKLDLWLKELRKSYRDRTLRITAEIAEAWGRLQAAGPLSAVDGLLASTALVHDLTLVTRNVRDVERTNVKVLNPFSRSRP